MTHSTSSTKIKITADNQNLASFKNATHQEKNTIRNLINEARIPKPKQKKCYGKMIINTVGGNKQLRQLAQSIAEFCADALFSSKLSNSINLDIEFSRTLYKEDGILGEIDYDDSNYRPREFTITVDCTVSKRRIMETIAHEMVHLKQYVKGELLELAKCGSVRWQNQLVDSKINYWDLPWEVEAHGKELGLFIRWAEHNNLGNQDWTQEKYA